MINELRQPIRLEPVSETVSPLGNGERDDIFDILKGLAILFVIVGHCEVGYLHSFIYSFHIPLFFFVSGYFLKNRPVRDEIRLNLKRLIFPYTFTAICICIVAVGKDLSNYTYADGSYTQRIIITCLIGFMGKNAPQHMDNIGTPWFFLALFWARTSAVLIINKIKSIKFLCAVVLFLSMVGMVLEKFFFFPFCIPQGLYALSFVYVGYIFRTKDLFNSTSIKFIFPFFLILWFFSLAQNGVNFAEGQFPTGYIFGLFGAIGAIITLYITIKHLYYKESILWHIVNFCGHYSLIIYSIHAIEVKSCNWKAFALLHHIPLNHFTLFQISVRMIVVFTFTYIILKIRPIRSGVFQIRTHCK